MKLQDLLTQYEATRDQLRQQGRTVEAKQYDQLIENCMQMIAEFQSRGRRWQPAINA